MITSTPHVNALHNRTTLSSTSNQESVVHIRLRIYPCGVHSPADILSQLTSNYGVWCQLNPASGRHRGSQSIDLELRGTIAQVCCSLEYLESLNLKIVSKANTSGDGWHV